MGAGRRIGSVGLPNAEKAAGVGFLSPLVGCRRVWLRPPPCREYCEDSRWSNWRHGFTGLPCFLVRFQSGYCARDYRLVVIGQYARPSAASAYADGDVAVGMKGRNVCHRGRSFGCRAAPCRPCINDIPAICECHEYRTRHWGIIGFVMLAYGIGG